MNARCPGRPRDPHPSLEALRMRAVRERGRSHTSLTGAADAQIAVRRDGPITCTVEHMKDGPIGAEIYSTLEVVEVRYTI